MGYETLKKRAKNIVCGRSIKPDMLYILYAFFLGITIIGLPIAYSVMLEYRKYLYLCMKKYDEATEEEKQQKNKLYEFTHPRSVLFDYSIKNMSNAFKAVLKLAVPFSACFFDMPHLSYDRSMEVKLGLVQLKMYFIYIFCAEICFIFLLCFMLFSGSVICTLICVATVIVLASVMLKPLAVYCQAYAIYEKQCLDMPSSDEYEQNDEA